MDHPFSNLMVQGTQMPWGLGFIHIPVQLLVLVKNNYDAVSQFVKQINCVAIDIHFDFLNSAD